MASKVTYTFLQAHFNGSSEAEATKLSALLATLQASTPEDVSIAVRDWSDAFKGQPERATVQTRGSEVRALKSAMDVNFHAEAGKGYHATIAAARAHLANLGLNARGKIIVDASTRKQNAADAKLTMAMLKATNSVPKIDENGEVIPLQSRLADVAEAAQETVLQNTARTIAEGIMKRHGVEVAEAVVHALETLILNYGIPTRPANADDDISTGVNVPAVAVAA